MQHNTKKYEFNNVGVCLNPDIILDFIDKKVSVTIKIAPVPNGFCGGIRVTCRNHGYGHSCSKRSFYNTREEAINKERDQFIQYMKRNKESISDALRYKLDTLQGSTQKVPTLF